MKKIFLFSMKIGFFFIELTLIALLSLVIYIDVTASSVMLIPLAAVISATMIFTVIFFFRGILISFDKVRCVGLFSSRYSAFIKEQRTLVITKMSQRKLKIEIFGYNNDGDDTYAWLKNDTPTIINLFRASTSGNDKSIQKILHYFDTDDELIPQIISQDNFVLELDKTIVSTVRENDNKVYKIFFKETL